MFCVPVVLSDNEAGPTATLLLPLLVHNANKPIPISPECVRPFANAPGPIPILALPVVCEHIACAPIATLQPAIVAVASV